VSCFRPFFLCSSQSPLCISGYGRNKMSRASSSTALFEDMVPETTGVANAACGGLRLTGDAARGIFTTVFSTR
jgi:hypothetical protein